MPALREWIRRLWGTLRRSPRDRDLEDELKLHLELAEELAEEAARRQGDPSVSPSEAARLARLRAGGSAQAMEALRDQRGLPWLDDLGRDVRYGLRNLRASPGFALVTIATLALGIGANTAIFSIVNAALLRPLPFPEPDRLVAVYSVNPSPNGGLWTVAPADYRDWREQSSTIERLTAYSGSGLSVWLGERPENVLSARVTANFFETLGVAPLLGRGFQPEDEVTATATVVLSHRFWQSRLGGDPAIVGTSLRTAAGPVTVVGVMPPAFEFPDYADLWTPMGPGEMHRRAVRYWQTVGRLRSGSSLEAAQTEMEALAARLGELYPNDNQGWSAQVMPLDRALVQDVRQALWILMGAVGFVIVIGCANVAGLTLARSTARRREVAVRLALGATRGRLVRQLFAEGLLLAALGAAAGLLIARWGVGAFFGLLPQTSWTSLVGFRDRVDLDGTVLLFAVLVTTATAIVLTLAPVWDAWRLGLTESVRTGASRTDTRSEHRAYKTLVAAQVACAIVLLAGAGLLVQSFVRMTRVDYGYDPGRLVTMSLPIQPQAWPAFVADTLEQIKAAPGVESAAMMSFERFGQLNFPFNLADEPFSGGDVLVRYSSVTDDYFRVLGSRVLTGRVFDARDSAEAPGVAVINEALAREYFPGGDPVGREIVLVYNNERIPRRIIGVVSNVRQDEPSEPIKPEILVPWPQLPWLGGTLVLRTNGDAGTPKRVQEIMWSADRNLPASRVQTVEEILSVQVATPRLYTILLGLFSAVAVTLAVLGLYGLLAYVTGRRTGEIAIRFALGARSDSIVRLVIVDGLRLSAAGVVIGLAGAVVLTRAMRGLLFEVAPADPLTLAAVALLLLGVAAAACYVPARRAAAVDPMVALRQE
jgi:predicted permease